MKTIKQMTVLVAAFLILLTSYGVPQLPVYAESVNDFDNTSVESDLSDLDLTAYPLDAQGSAALAAFTEYCYTPNVWNCENYGLYLYVYNPAQKAYTSTSGVNGINIATGYTANGEPAVYDRLPLKLCGVTTKTGYEGLIYKFRIEDAEELYINAKDYETEYGCRRYDIAALYLYETGKTVAESVTVNREYRYTGYAKGYAEESETESTLSCTWKQGETIDLKVYQTHYRMPSEYAEDTRHEVNTVYFSVPDKYISDYGNLQKIKAQWYEYKTQPIFVTQDTGAYAALMPYVGKDIGEKDESLSWRVIWNTELENTSEQPSVFINSIYNKIDDPNFFNTYKYWKNTQITPQISWLFSTGGADYSSYKVSQTAMTDWANGYAKTYGKTADILDRYSSELFTDSIDADRVSLLSDPSRLNGKIVREFDAEEEFNLLAYDDTHSGWDRFWDYFWNWDADTSGKTYCPIEEITAAALTSAKDTFCENWLIDTDDYATVKEFGEQSIEAGEHPFVFRFAQTDYYSTKARFDYVTESGSGSGISDVDGYVAQETVFLDFTVISLTFRKDGTDTVIGVAATPIDIINGTDPPIETTDSEWWERILKILLGVIGGILLLWLLSLFISPLASFLVFVVKLLVKIVCLPFRVIGKLFEKKR